MNFNKTTIASATTAALSMMAAGNAQALNFGEFWAADQINGLMHIWQQDALNAPGPAAKEVVHFQNRTGSADGGMHTSARLHILGFSNASGLDPSSRVVATYLDGWAEIWNTATHDKIADLEASTNSTYAAAGMAPPDKGNTIHACGHNPTNNLIACASIFNGDVTLFSSDVSTDTYTRIGISRLADIPVSPGLAPLLKAQVQGHLDTMYALDANPNNICNQFDTSGTLLYVAAQTGTTTGGVIVLDVSNPANPTILDAYADVMAAGCGLVNHPGGTHLWITQGFNKHGDPEEMTMWNYAAAGIANGPSNRVAFATDDSQPVYGGDAHGAQFAGLGNNFMWQTMRIDDNIQVLSAWNSDTSALVNQIDLERPGRLNVQPDVIDRSQFGNRMYHTTRGPVPTSAIGSTAIGAANKYNFASRSGSQGVDVLATIFGYGGRYVKTEVMLGLGTNYLCPAANYPDSEYDVLCELGDAGAVPVDNADPHGGKSINYLTGF